MAITMVDFDGFETGGTEGLTSSNTAVVASSPSPWTSKETYHCRVANGFAGRYFQSAKITSPSSSTWITMGFYMRMEDLPANEGSIFQAAVTGGATHWVLRIDGDGDLAIDDANGSEVDRANTIVSADTWYRIVFKWKWDNSTSFKCWFGQQGTEPSLIFDESTMDTKNAGSNDIGCYFLNTCSAATASPCYVGSYYFRTDDGTAWDDEDTTFGVTTATMGDWTVLGPYDTAETTGVDYGSATALSFTGGSGTWNSCIFDVPYDNTSRAQHTDSFGSGTNRESGIYTDNGSTGGPSGDSNADNETVGGKWISVWQGSHTGKTAPKYQMWIGANGTHATDTVYGPGTSAQAVRYVTGDDNGGSIPYPSVSQTFDVGWKTQFNGASAAYMRVIEFWTFVLHAETPPGGTRLVICDGVSIQAS